MSRLLMGQSDDSAMLEIYLTAGILFILVAMAGCFMIASSFNMSILERIQFFGLLRCLGNWFSGGHGRIWFTGKAGGKGISAGSRYRQP